MRVLVTGATGFIGSHVVRELVARGHEAVALARPGTSLRRLGDVLDQISIVECDLEESASIGRIAMELRPGAIIHLAWYAEPGKYSHDVSQNLASLRASTRLLDASRQSDCPRVVLAGTCLENSDRPARSVYEASKRAIHAVSEGFGTTDMTIACGHVYHVLGPGEDARRVVPSIIRAVLRSESIPTTDGAQMRDYLHVADVASAFCTLAEASVTGGIDICSGSTISLRDLFEIIGTETGKETLIKIGALGPGVDDVQPAAGDPAPLRALGWLPRHDLRDAVIESINFWRSEEARP